MIDFTLEELDFLIDYCNEHISDCEDMTYSVSEEAKRQKKNVKLLNR